MEPSTDELLDRWVAGDTRAAEELYLRYRERVCQFARRLGASDFDADDVAEEAMIAGLEAAKGDRPQDFTCWVMGVARNLTLKKFRDRLRQAGNPEADLALTAGVRTMAIRGEMAGLLSRFLRELPPGMREVMELQHRGNLSREQIARRLGIPLRAVHARLERSYERLRGRLARHFTSRVVLKPSVGWAEIQDLRPSFREAVVVRHLEGLSPEAGAKRLRIPVATLEARLQSAYADLKCAPDADFSAAREEWYRRRQN